MKIVFFGTPDYVLPILEALHRSFKNPKIESGVVAVVTQPPKPTGRKQKLEYSPVDSWAYKKNIPIFHKADDFIKSEIKGDVGILASYGEIISKFVISHLKFGILNIHPSLLPNWRGASPLQASIISGDEITGVTIIKLDERLDHGPIISKYKEKILDTDTTESLRNRLFQRSADVIASLLPAYIKGKIKSREQEHKSATFTRQIKKDDAFIDPSALSAVINGKSVKKKWDISFIRDLSFYHSPFTIHRFIRAMQPWPISWTYVQLNSKLKAPRPRQAKRGGQSSKRLKILKAHLEEKSNVKGQMSLVLDEVQLEGKNPVPYKQFKEAYKTAIFE